MILSIIIFLPYVFFIAQHSLFKYASLFLGIMVIGQIIISSYFWMKRHQEIWGIYCLGWVIYTISALQQFLKISIPALGLNYNTLYHLLVGVSWSIIFYAVKELKKFE